jgi:hypothetical protein
MTAVRFEDLSMMSGLHLNPSGLLACDMLANVVNAVEACTYDWVHNMLQDGVFSSEIRAFLQRTSTPKATVQQFLQRPWEFPHFHAVKSKQLHRVFDERRSIDGEKIKASCSELLGVYGLLRHFVQVEVPDNVEFATARASFFAACTVLDLLLAAKFRFQCFAETVHQAETSLAAGRASSAGAGRSGVGRLRNRKDTPRGQERGRSY